MGNDVYNDLLDAMIPFAQELLEKHGEFHPFAMAVNLDGEIGAVSVDFEEESPDPEQVIAGLIDGLREGALQNQFLATGLCSNVTVVLPGTGAESDAISIALEHRDLPPGQVVLPYVLNSDSEVEFGKLMAKAGASAVFREER